MRAIGAIQVVLSVFRLFELACESLAYIVLRLLVTPYACSGVQVHEANISGLQPGCNPG